VDLYAKNLCQGPGISQTLNRANQSTAAFNTAIVRVNKHFQVTYLYFSYQEVRALKLNISCLRTQTKNGSYKIPVMTLTNTKIIQQFGTAEGKMELNTAFASKYRPSTSLNYTSKHTCKHIHTMKYNSLQGRYSLAAQYYNYLTCWY
jgi:predicted nucleic acid-binding Zn finger protein